MPDTKTKRIPIYLYLVTIFLLGGIVFAGKTVIGALARERTAYNELRMQIDDIQHKREELALAQAAAKSIDSDIATIKNAFVDQSDILKALVPLEQEAAAAGIVGYKVTVAQDISSAVATPKSSESDPNGTTLRIEGGGTLENIFAFIRTLQGLPYFFRVETLQIEQTGLTAPSGSPSGTPLQILMIIKFYSLPEIR